MANTSAKGILLTGASGFLGTYILQTLRASGYRVVTLGRTRVAGTDHVTWSADEVAELGDRAFDRVIHVAGRAHSVPRSRTEVEAFDSVNRIGTLNLLRGLERLARLPELLIQISTVAVYAPRAGSSISERALLHPDSTYGESKLASERASASWTARRGVGLLVLRLPLVVAPTAPGNLAAIRRGLRTGRYFTIGSGDARKSIVRPDDVAELVSRPTLPEGTYNLTDGVHPTVREINEAVADSLGAQPPKTMPLVLARGLALCGDLLSATVRRDAPITTTRLVKLTRSLIFDDSMAREHLDWRPRPGLALLRQPAHPTNRKAQRR